MSPSRLFAGLALPLALVLGGVAATAAAQEKSVKPGINDNFKDPDLKKYLGSFEIESREIYSLRDKIVAACKLKPGLAVADIGAGTGLYTRLFAKAVGPKGKVYAVDIAPKFLDHIQKTSKEAGLKNVQTIRCNQRSSELPAGSIDVAFICDTYHHFEFPQRTLATIHSALRPGGRLILIDFHRIPGKSRPFILGHVRAGQEVFVKEIVEAGFKQVGEEKGLGLKENYFVRFVKVDKSAEKKRSEIQFNRDVRPILSDACFTCHGPDRSKRKSGLRLDTEAGKSVVVAGRPDESELIQRLTSDDVSRQMPPAKLGKKLTAAQIAVLRQWVADGAKWEPHWAFVPPRRPTPPAVEAAHNPIDAFLRDRLRKEGLDFSPEADRRTLIRRLTLDLTGLPPTPDEVDAFVSDSRPDAYERLVDRLLASPRFGERLAYDWLDAARYADSNGYQSDRDRIMWPWRDWAVRAFNANQSFDQFTIEQLAGDLLPAATTEQRLATGFHRNHMLNGEGGRIAEESRIDYVIDRVDTTATVWLGLTLGCSRCHDHKYDPFTQKDYYGLFAFFNNVPETGGVDRGGNANPVMEFPTPQQEKQRKTIRDQIRALEREVKAADKANKAELQKRLKEKRDALTRLDRAVLSVMVMQERPTPRETHLLLRGAWDKPGDKVTAAVLGRLAPPAEGAPANRLGLARWLVSAQNPLAARVLVNRYWQLFFAAGLVRTPEDFGVQGEPPDHPELLDWLAVEFRDGGWDTKRLVRLLVTSRTYRQSSALTPRLRERDPDNRLLSRAPRYRLPAVTIRDQALALSGLFVERIGGPPVRPYQPPGIWEEFSFGFIRYRQDRGIDLYRRSLYTFWRRTVAPTTLFDTAGRQVCEVRPSRTNTPLHALVTLNDVTYAEAHRVLAARVMREGGRTSAERLTWLFRLATARPPDDREQTVLDRAHRRLLAHYRADTAAARLLVSAGEAPADATADVAELAALTGVASLVLNLDEVISRE